MSNVQFQFSIENEDGEEVILEVSCNVSMEHDPYGTGDSPTAYYVEDVELDGYDWDSLHSYYQQRIEQKAVEEFRGY